MTKKIKISFYLLLLGLASEIIGPIVFHCLTPNYDSFRQLISDFGVQGAKTQQAFTYWSLFDGSLILLGSFGVYGYFKKVQSFLALLLASGIGLFAIGDCIFTGIFHRETGGVMTWTAYLHDGASGLGFVTFYGGLLCLFFLYQKTNQPKMSYFIFGNLILAGLFMLIFALPKIPFLNLGGIPRGFFQRGNLFFMYFPYIVMTLSSLKNSKKPTPASF